VFEILQSLSIEALGLIAVIALEVAVFAMLFLYFFGKNKKAAGKETGKPGSQKVNTSGRLIFIENQIIMFWLVSDILYYKCFPFTDNQEICLPSAN
jgi:heme/copper-type cytochrome/quinol oxidase subunit 3